MSGEMVERVRLALVKELDVNFHVEDYDSHALARAAIEAMREPTEEMVDAGWEPTADQPVTCWRAMIDAALADSPTTEDKA